MTLFSFFLLQSAFSGSRIFIIFHHHAPLCRWSDFTMLILHFCLRFFLLLGFFLFSYFTRISSSFFATHFTAAAQVSALGSWAWITSWRYDAMVVYKQIIDDDIGSHTKMRDGKNGFCVTKFDVLCCHRWMGRNPISSVSTFSCCRRWRQQQL